MTPPAYEIRPFGGLELGAAETLHGASFPAAWDQPWSRQSFAETLAMPGTFGLMARDAQNAALGLIVVRTAADEAEILTIAVDAKARRQGIGAALIGAARLEARTRGAARLHLEVAEDNFAARRLYADLGFEPVGKRSGYYARGTLGSVSAILMACAL